MSRDLGKRQKVTIFDPEILGATKKTLWVFRVGSSFET